MVRAASHGVADLVQEVLVLLRCGYGRWGYSSLAAERFADLGEELVGAGLLVGWGSRGDGRGCRGRMRSAQRVADLVEDGLVRWRWHGDGGRGWRAMRCAVRRLLLVVEGRSVGGFSRDPW